MRSVATTSHARTSAFFFLMTPRTPRSTLFPYTTLFRSSRYGTGTSCSPSGAASKQLPTARDRKSTRLNSSHVRISYAVFCLKKKKKNSHPYTTHLPSQTRVILHTDCRYAQPLSLGPTSH